MADRKLTDAEKRRKERYERLKAGLEKQGYAARELTIDVTRAGWLSLFVMLPFAAALFIWFVLAHPGALKNDMLRSVLLSVPVYLALIVAHELIHGLVWGLCAPGRFRAIEFGVMRPSMTPYCACGEPLTKGQYVWGAAMPTLILGFGLGAASVFTCQPFLMLAAAWMIFGGGGDFLIILKLLRAQEKPGALYVDHPCECGLVVFETESPPGGRP